MKYLQTYNLFERYSEWNYVDFLESLRSELQNIDFELNYSFEDDFLDIFRSGVGTFISIGLSGFTIEGLKEECIEKLEDSKLKWKCSEVIKDDYDLLCTTILVFIDEYN